MAASDPLTTGTCAAAAASAAVERLVAGTSPREVSVVLPGGSVVTVEIAELRCGNGSASAVVVKPDNSDRDITTGLRVAAEVGITTDGRVAIEAGEGVGTVTYPGLAVAPGGPAINPVPREMIEQSVRDRLPASSGARVRISIPNGAELAERTFNSKLGIVGGLSILGTTGLVKPMSGRRWREALLPQLNVAAASGLKPILLTPGNIGQRACERELGAPGIAVVQMSNFVGFMLEAAVKIGGRDLLLVGHPGKLLKLADGHFNTDGRRRPLKFDTLVDLMLRERVDNRVVARVRSASTAEEVVSVLRNDGNAQVLNGLATMISASAGRRIKSAVAVGTVLVNLRSEVVGRDCEAVRILKEANWSM